MSRSRLYIPSTTLIRTKFPHSFFLEVKKKVNKISDLMLNNHELQHDSYQLFFYFSYIFHQRRLNSFRVFFCLQFFFLVLCIETTRNSIFTSQNHDFFFLLSSWLCHCFDARLKYFYTRNKNISTQLMCFSLLFAINLQSFIHT